MLQPAPKVGQTVRQYAGSVDSEGIKVDVKVQIVRSLYYNKVFYKELK